MPRNGTVMLACLGTVVLACLRTVPSYFDLWASRLTLFDLIVTAVCLSFNALNTSCLKQTLWHMSPCLSSSTLSCYTLHLVCLINCVFVRGRVEEEVRPHTQELEHTKISLFFSCLSPDDLDKLTTILKFQFPWLWNRYENNPSLHIGEPMSSYVLALSVTADAIRTVCVCHRPLQSQRWWCLSASDSTSGVSPYCYFSRVFCKLCPF